MGVRYIPGYIPYDKALKIQYYLVQRLSLSEKGFHVLLLLQHPPTYTAGRRIKGTIRTEGDRLKKLGADYFEVNRGGQTTFHGPGQLVGYPILSLKALNVRHLSGMI